MYTLGMQIPRRSVRPGVIQMCLRSNFPPSRRTHMRLRSDDRKNSTMNFNYRCLTQNSHVLRLLADFVYHPVCGWNESSVGGKETYFNFNNTPDETNLSCFSLQCIFYDVKWNIITVNNIVVGSHPARGNVPLQSLLFLQQVNAAAIKKKHNFLSILGKWISESQDIIRLDSKTRHFKKSVLPLTMGLHYCSLSRKMFKCSNYVDWKQLSSLNTTRQVEILYARHGCF